MYADVSWLCVDYAAWGLKYHPRFPGGYRGRPCNTVKYAYDASEIIQL